MVSWFRTGCLWLALLGLSLTAQAAPQNPLESILTQGRFGHALNMANKSLTLAQVKLDEAMRQPPVLIEFWCKINSVTNHNILLAAGPKSGTHWELYTNLGTGELRIYSPLAGGDIAMNNVKLEPGRWYAVALLFRGDGFECYLDGQNILRQPAGAKISFDASPLRIGGIENETLGLDGVIDELKVSHPAAAPALDGHVPEGPATPDENTLVLMNFDTLEGDQIKNLAPAHPELTTSFLTDLTMPQGNRFLDEVMNDVYDQSPLAGDSQVEAEINLPVTKVEAKPAGTSASAERPAVLSLNGEWLMKGSTPRTQDALRINWTEGEGVAKGWWKEGADRGDWLKVQVPTTVQSALVKAGKLPDPMWDTNNYDELTSYGQPRENPSWPMRRTRVEQQDWWFAKSFTLPAELKSQTLRLYCDGIDCGGSFYLNGQPIGYHAGMFGGPNIDITRLVRFDRPNELVIRIDRAADSWFGLLKGSPGFGWHYGHLISMGIWRDVQIQAVAPLEIESPFVKTVSASADAAVLNVEYAIRSHAAAPVDVVLAGHLAGKNFNDNGMDFNNSIRVAPGLNRFQTEIHLTQPRLWWPLNYGDPNLYQLTLNVAADGSAPAQAGAVTFGVRTLEVRPLRGTRAETDYRWQFVINGVPLFIKGANWCWSDPMLERDPAKYEQLLELARRGGIQMFRAWGGGIAETDTFYDKCDEKGLLVYQEFPFCWGPPDFPLTNAQAADQQLTTIIKRLRNHPALIMWGGGNENVEIKGADEGLLLAGRRSHQFDPTRPFHRTDPWGGSIHNWSVFHNGAPIDGSFMSTPSPWLGEYGLPSMPNRASCLKFLPEAKLDTWPPRQDDGGLMMHMNQFGFGDMAKVMRYCDYGPIRGWNDYIEYSQMAQGDEISFAGNLQRAGSYLNKGGFWFYKFTDLFPGHSWAVVDYYAAPKLSYYRAKQTCRPQAAFAFYPKFDWTGEEPFTAALHVSNDSNRPLTGATVEAVLYGSDLKPMWQQRYPVEPLGMSEQRKIDDLSVKLDPQRIKPFLMAVALRGADGTLLSDQWYWFNFQVKSEAMKQMEAIPAWGWPHERAPEAFKAYGEAPEARLLSLPRTNLSFKLERDGAKGRLVVKNEGKIPAFNVIIDGFPLTWGNFLDDNSFSLRPGETRAVAFDLATAGEKLDGLAARAWNAPLVKP